MGNVKKLVLKMSPPVHCGLGCVGVRLTDTTYFYTWPHSTLLLMFIWQSVFSVFLVIVALMMA
jgi:hypothetical protein